MILSVIVPVLFVATVGSSQTNVRVTTRTSGDSDTNTRVTTTVNGKTETVTSDSPGTIEVKRAGSSSDVTVNGIPITPVIPDAAKAEPAPTNGNGASLSGEPRNAIGDTKQSPFRYYVYGVFKQTVTTIRQYFENILDKL